MDGEVFVDEQRSFTSRVKTSSCVRAEQVVGALAVFEPEDPSPYLSHRPVTS
jgi:hypothetical protein